MRFMRPLNQPVARLMLFCSGLLLNGFLGGCGGPEKPAAPVGETRSTTTPSSSKSECQGAVFPSLATVESGEYKPLSRPLFIYVNTKALQQPDVAAYAKLLLNEAQDYVETAGFIKLNPQILKEQREKLAQATANVQIPAKLEKGNVSVDGSSTVFPFSVVGAELFSDAHGDKVKVTVGKTGTGGGFKRFVSGETDISNASRPIKQEEIELCKKNNIEFLELTVCVDGLSVCVNPANTWCDCISVEQLKALWEPGSKITHWNQLNPAWPKAEIKLYGADTDSGTFDYFTEAIVGKSKASRSDYTPSTEDNVLVRGIEGDKNSLGYFGYSYYDKNRDKLKVLGIIPAGSKPADDKAKSVQSDSSEKASTSDNAAPTEPTVDKKTP